MVERWVALRAASKELHSAELLVVLMVDCLDVARVASKADHLEYEMAAQMVFDLVFAWAGKLVV
jgi:hypothetical protein